MKSLGVPEDPWYYAANLQVCAVLAGLQATTISPGQAQRWIPHGKGAMVSKNMGGFQVFSSNALATRTNTTAADLAGALASNPTVTLSGAKDTMTQDWAVSGFTASAVIKAGSVVEVTGRYYVSRASRQVVLDALAPR